MRPEHNEQPPRFRKQCRRENVPGHAHFLTFSCFQRRPFLNRDRTRGWSIDAIDSARRKHAFDVWAYVIMPEHVHLIVRPRKDDYDISAILSCIKQAVAKRAVAFVKRTSPAFLQQMLDEQPNGRQSHRFWQRGGGFDRNLYSSAEIWEKIEYIHTNPVARGLVDLAVNWNWSSAADYAGLREGPLKLDLMLLPIALKR